MDCIIQVFPDEYHLQTLETLLGACPQLQVSNTVLIVFVSQFLCHSHFHNCCQLEYVIANFCIDEISVP